MSPRHSPNDTPVPGMKPVGVLVIDDQFAVREGVARLVAGAPIALRALEMAATIDQARSIAASLRPEVVVLDADLAGEDGLALIGQLGPNARVLVLTSHGDAATRARAKRRGALAFVEKQQPAADLIDALMEIAALDLGGDKAPGLEGASSLLPSAASSGARTRTRP